MSEIVEYVTNREEFFRSDGVSIFEEIRLKSKIRESLPNVCKFLFNPPVVAPLEEETSVVAPATETSGFNDSRTAGVNVRLSVPPWSRQPK